jgi:hypothetical protein
MKMIYRKLPKTASLSINCCVLLGFFRLYFSFGLLPIAPMTYTGFGIDEKDLWLSQSDRVEPAVREEVGRVVEFM